MLTITDIEQALAEPLPGRSAQVLMEPVPRKRIPHRQPPRCAAVTLLLYCQQERLSLLLIERAVLAHRQDAHSGQLALPGGKQEAGGC